MRQVPQNERKFIYGIIGDGRVARHFKHYFSLAGISFKEWSRKSALKEKKSVENKTVLECLKGSDIFLVLLSDDAIEDFVRQNLKFQDKPVIHFSGSLVTPLALGFHPLMTFGDELYDLKTYVEFPFIGELGSQSFSDLFPGLRNSFYSIPTDEKAFYHSLCVLSGNFTVLLWSKFFKELEDRFLIPKSAAFNYLDQIVKNLKKNPSKALTGPLVRKDRHTIERNLHALKNDEFEKIYETFVKVFFKEYFQEKAR